jgi:two-component system, OmpR family, sensor kinase
MQARLAAYVNDRTELVAAIAHDLRTPLTRLAFRIESLDGPEKAAMAADVQEMEQMVAATMGFARAAQERDAHQRLELGSLVERVAEDMRLTGRRVSADALDAVVIDGDPLSLRRLFTNLFDNGEKFGGSAHARIYREGASAIVDIEDAGPGLTPGSETRVFEPFFRLEPSRSRETGGIGLGLAVVRSIARAHGGDVTLANRPQGGLRARVTLPLASAK